jgi:dihydrofolate reductase
MPKVYADIAISLDGFIAGTNISIENPLGIGGEKLIWYGDDVNNAETDYSNSYKEVDSRILEESAKSEGAVIMGRTTFEVSIDAWGDDPPIHKPCFVLTHRPVDNLIKGNTIFHFVNKEPKEILGMAIEAAIGKDVCVMGGASTIAQFINLGLLNELHLHMIPTLLGDGIKLFDKIDREKINFKKISVLDGERATHILLEVQRNERKKSRHN